MIRQRMLFYAFFIAFSLVVSHFLHADQAVTFLEGVELGWEGWFTLVVITIALAAMIKEVRPPDIVMLIAASVLVVSGILTPKEFLRGFSGDILVTIAMICVLVRALEVNGILNVLSTRILPKHSTGGGALCKLLFPVAALSAFLNNTVIVLMMTPLVRKWALNKELSPSKFLIPLSYASVVGGMCTLIGTSTNLIVDGLLRREDPSVGFAFFELGAVGIPCTLAVIGVLVLVGFRLLPVRVDTTTALSEQTAEFTGEFIVEKECPFAHKIIQEAGGKHFQGELLVEIEREGRILTAPNPYEIILPGDRLVFAGDIHEIAELHTIEGLTSAADPHFRLDEKSSHFSEVVVSLTSSLIGKTLQQANFRKRYGASVLAIYRQGKRLQGNVGEIYLDAGDTLVILSSEQWAGDRFLRDFYYIRHGEKLSIFNPWRAAFIAAVLVGMVSLVLMGTQIMIAAISAVLMLVLTKTVTIKEAQRGILWNVLLLIASSFAVATAAEVTGVTTVIAKVILSIFGTQPMMMILGILLLNSLFTEMLSNNAAALLLFPVALQTVRLAGFTGPESLKAVGVAVAIGSSCGFSLPTGYQTHMIVYGPGGYRFTDFLKVGVLTDAIVITLGALIIPTLWPLVGMR